MIQFSITNRFTGAVNFTAEIDCAEDGGEEVSLAHCDLRGADMSGGDLRREDLCGVNLWGVNLSSADLRDANLRHTNFIGANLKDVDFRGADLRGSDLRDADLGGADIRFTLLWGADFRGANMLGAKLWDKEQKIAPLQIIGLRHPIATDGQTVLIDDREYLWDRWLAFSDDEISRIFRSLLHTDALEWWKSHLGLIASLVEQHNKLEALV